MKIIYAVLTLIALYVLVSLGTIIKNNPSLTANPGLMQRLKLFLSTNRAETADQPVFPELITPSYQIPEQQLHSSLVDAGKALGWEVVENSAHDIAFVMTTRVFRFKDDITVDIEAINGTSNLKIISQSRTGRADFAANLNNILSLKKQLESQPLL